MIFRNAKFKHYTALMEEAGPIYRLHFTADVTAPNADEMGWDVLNEQQEFRAGMKGSPLEGALSIAEFLLTPNEKELAKHELAAEGGEIRDFKITTHKVDGRKQAELRFVLVTTGPIAKIDKYWRTIKTADARLTVKVQARLDTTEDEEGEPSDEPADDAQGNLNLGEETSTEADHEPPKRRGRPRKPADEA